MIFQKPSYNFANSMEYSESDIYAIWLASVDGMRAIWGKYLISKYGSPKEIWDNCNDISPDQQTDGDMPGIPESLINQLKFRKNKAYLDRLLGEMKTKRIYAVPNGHPYYPPLLSEIDDPPLVLFVRGNVNLSQERMIAIVGSRKSTRNGETIARGLAHALSISGVVVVSGMAMGIDRFAGEGALKGPTPTFAILGSGTDVIYPPENAWLYNKIIESGGAVISEYIPGTKTAKWHFPTRNRIISGMCQGVVVVQAPERSGVIHTVNSASDQGRCVFAVPDSPLVPQSALPNKLIGEGCCLVTSSWDVLEEFSWGARPPKYPPNKSPAQNEKYGDNEVNTTTGVGSTTQQDNPPPQDDNALRAALCDELLKNIDTILAGHNDSADKKAILFCINSQEMSQNDISDVTGLPVHQVNSYLTMLELESIIEQVQSGNYRLRLEPGQEA